MPLEQSHCRGRGKTVDQGTALRTTRPLFVNHGSIFGDGDLISCLAKTQTKIAVIAIHEEALVKPPYLFTHPSRHKDTRAGQVAVPIQAGGSREVGNETCPQVNPAAAPSLHLSGIVHVIQDRTNGPGAWIRLR